MKAFDVVVEEGLESFESAIKWLIAIGCTLAFTTLALTGVVVYLIFFRG